MGVALKISVACVLEILLPPLQENHNRTQNPAKPQLTASAWSLQTSHAAAGKGVNVLGVELLHCQAELLPTMGENMCVKAGG